MRGTLLQAWITCAFALTVAVLSYFVTVRLVGPYQYPPLFSPSLLFWIILALLGGFGFVCISLMALNRTWLTWLAVGTVVGLLMGDGFNSSIGIPWLDEWVSLDAIWQMRGSYGPVVNLAAIASGIWIVSMAIFHRRYLARSWLFIPGVRLGYARVTVPELLLHYV